MIGIQDLLVEIEETLLYARSVGVGGGKDDSQIEKDQFR